MKSVLFQLGLSLLLIGSARGADGLPPLPPENLPPKVEIVLPANGARFISPANVAIAASASDPDDRVRTVEFFADRTSIGIRTNVPSLNPSGENPFRMTWKVTAPGTYALTAKARDIMGAEAVSQPVSITVVETKGTTVSVVASVPETRESTPGQPAEFKVVRTGSLNHKLNVHYRLTGNARNGVDYKQLPGMVTIPIGETAAAVAITPVPDNALEGNETVTLVLDQRFYILPPPIEDSYLVVEPRTASVVIRENTIPGGFPPKVDIVQPVAGATFPAGTDIPVKVDAADADGYIGRVQLFADGKLIGVESRNYLVKPPSGEIAHFSFVWQGATSGTHELVARATDDIGLESSSAPVKITVGADTTLPVVTVVAPDATASESDPADTAYFKILRTGSMATKLVVHYLVEGTAGNGTDYEKLSGIATIAPGEGSAPLVIKPVPDKAIEGRETVVIRIIKPLSTTPPTPEEIYSIGEPSTATAVIAESGSTGSPPKVAILEPVSGASFPARSDISVRIDAVDADGYITLAELYVGDRLVASEPRVYVTQPPPGEIAQFKLVWKDAPAGEHVLTAKARDDAGLVGYSARIKVVVKSPTSNLPVVTIATSDGEAHENDPKNTAVFKAIRTGPTTGKLTVRYSTSGSASNGTDYEKLPGTLTFLEGQETTAIVITAIPDQKVEGKESATVRIEAPSSTSPAADQNYLVGSPRSATATIVDGTVPNSPPKVAIVTPKNEAQFSTPTDVELKAEAADADGKVVEVSFYAGEKLLGTLREPPFVFVWKNAPAGRHVLVAKVRDDRGATTTSSRVVISVKDPLTATFVKRDLPDSYQPGRPLKVMLEAAPHSSVQSYAVEDRIPKGWSAGTVTEGTHDAASGKVKFGPFFDNKPRTLVYEVTPPAGDSGRKEFSGSASANGRNSTVGGDRVIEAADLRHPADNSRPEFSISLDELTAYGLAWKSGQTWPDGPNPIPQDYVTRAALIWQQGERYIYDATKGEAPLCWVPKPAQTTVARAESISDKLDSALAALTTRSKAMRKRSNSGTGASSRVVVVVAPRNGVQAFTLEERIPSGWKVSGISDGGVFDPVSRTIRWGIFFDDRTRTLSYEVTAPAVADDTKGIQGTASFDGADVKVAEAPVPNGLGMEILGRLKALLRRADGSVAVTFTGEAGGRYAVEVSSDLIQWRSLQEVQCDSDSFVAIDPQAPTSGPRYYRAVPRD